MKVHAVEGFGLDVHTPLRVTLRMDCGLRQLVGSVPPPFRSPEGCDRARWRAVLEAEADVLFVQAYAALDHALAAHDLTRFWKKWCITMQR
eukprot:12827117-Alexandrium_andersonii.AAC.1